MFLKYSAKKMTSESLLEHVLKESCTAKDALKKIF